MTEDDCPICENGVLNKCYIGGGLRSTKCSACQSIVTNAEDAKYNKNIAIMGGYMNDYTDTTELQLESLVLFASGLGYDPVWDNEGKLLRFRSDKYKASGEQYTSVRRMIKHHNEAANLVWRHVSTVNTSFSDFIDNPGGEHMINLLFAGNCKIIETVKGQWSHKKGFFVHPTKSNHMVRFMTKKTYNMYKHYVGE